ncbi:MAG: hypothetical protein K6V36_16155 [Anaerolineae bacterium]|nr:hypothetical protein [Anaerolineae bacterium]
MRSLLPVRGHRSSRGRSHDHRAVSGLMGVGVVLLLGLALLAGCGQGPSQSGVTATPPQEATPRATFTAVTEASPTAVPGSTAPAAPTPGSYDAVPGSTAPAITTPTPVSYDATPGYYTTSTLRPTAGQMLRLAGLLAGGLVLGLLTVPPSHIWRGRRR